MEEPATTGERLRALREEHAKKIGRRYSQRDAAKEFQVNEHTYRGYELDKANVPRSLAERLATAWGASSPDWFYSGSGSVNSQGQVFTRSLAGTPMKPIRVVGNVAAGPGVHNVDTERREIYVPESLATIGGLGWVVDGSSAVPLLEDGDIAIFREYQQPRSKFAYLIKSRDGYKVKILDWDRIENRWVLKSINPSEPTVPMEPGEQLLGFMIGWYKTKGKRETIDSDPDGLTFD